MCVIVQHLNWFSHFWCYVMQDRSICECQISKCIWSVAHHICLMLMLHSAIHCFVVKCRVIFVLSFVCISVGAEKKINHGFSSVRFIIWLNNSINYCAPTPLSTVVVGNIGNKKKENEFSKQALGWCCILLIFHWSSHNWYFTTAKAISKVSHKYDNNLNVGFTCYTHMVLMSLYIFYSRRGNRRSEQICPASYPPKP
jgi:hypothetical protein